MPLVAATDVDQTPPMALALGLLAALSIGLSDLFGRRITAASTALTAAATMQIFAALTVVVFAVLDRSPFAAGAFGFGVLSGIGMGGGLGLYYTGLLRSTSTIVSPLVATLSALIPFGYTALRGTKVTGIAVGGVLLAVVGLVVITSGAISPERMRTGVIWGVCAGMAYGSAGIAFIEASDDDGWWPGLGQRAMAFVLLAGAAIVAKAPVIAPAGQRLNAAAAGSLTGITSVAYLAALSISHTIGVVTLATFPAFSVVVGRVFFNDAVQRSQVIGICLVIGGVAAVAIG